MEDGDCETMRERERAVLRAPGALLTVPMTPPRPLKGGAVYRLALDAQARGLSKSFGNVP